MAQSPRFLLPGKLLDNDNGKLLDDLLAKLYGSTKNVGDLPRRNVGVALQFFQEHGVGLERMLTVLRGIDLHKRVTRLTLPEGTKLTQYSQLDADGKIKVGEWFSRGDVSDRELGIAKGNRVRRTFGLTRDIDVLSSTAAHTVDRWTQGRAADVNSLAPPQLDTGEKKKRDRTEQGGKPRDLYDKGVRAGEMAWGGGEQWFLPNTKALSDLGWILADRNDWDGPKRTREERKLRQDFAEASRTYQDDSDVIPGSIEPGTGKHQWGDTGHRCKTPQSRRTDRLHEQCRQLANRHPNAAVGARETG